MPAELLRVNAQTPEADVLRYAAHFLARGCVIGIPTDTLYGLAADPFNLAAVDEIYRVKGLPETRALPILVNSLRIAVRWPGSEVVRRLIAEFDGPITGTSANIPGFPACSNAEQVMKQMGDRLPLVLDAGETGAALPSTIVELHGDAWKIIREGAIPVTEIERALK